MEAITTFIMVCLVALAVLMARPVAQVYGAKASMKRLRSRLQADAAPRGQMGASEDAGRGFAGNADRIRGSLRGDHRRGDLRGSVDHVDR